MLDPCHCCSHLPQPFVKITLSKTGRSFKYDRMISVRLMLQLLGFLILSRISALRSGSTTKQKKRDERRDLQATVGVVEDFILINSAADEAIATIENGATFNMATLNKSRFNIKATVSGNVQSIKFGYNDESSFHDENGPTYAFCGHTGSNFFRCEVLVVGEHTITATPYSEKDLDGVEGSPVQITFNIIDEKEPATPTQSPIEIPMNCKIPKVRQYIIMLSNTFDVLSMINIHTFS